MKALLIFLLLFEVTEYEQCLETNLTSCLEEIKRADSECVQECNKKITENQIVIDKCVTNYNKLVTKIYALRRQVKRLKNLSEKP